MALESFAARSMTPTPRLTSRWRPISVPLLRTRPWWTPLASMELARKDREAKGSLGGFEGARRQGASLRATAAEGRQDPSETPCRSSRRGSSGRFLQHFRGAEVWGFYKHRVEGLSERGLGGLGLGSEVES